MQPWTTIPSASAMSAWQWQEVAAVLTHSPFNTRNKNRVGERKTKQIKSIPASTKLSIKPWKPEILDPCCWLIEYVFGIQDRWIFIYPFTYLGEMMRRQRGQIKRLHYQQLYSKFNALFFKTGLRLLRSDCLQTGSICSAFCTDVTHQFLLPRAYETPDHLI